MRNIIYACVILVSILIGNCGNLVELEDNHATEQLALEKGITRIPLGNGYWLKITGIHHHSAPLPNCLSFLGEKKKHMNVIFNRDNIPYNENPLLDIHITWWKNSVKPKYCFGIVATKGKNKKYGSNNTVFCYHNCSNSKLKRIQETWNQVKAAYFAGQLAGLTMYLAWYTFPVIIEILAPKFTEYAKSLVGMAPAPPAEFGGSPPPSPSIPESDEDFDNDPDDSNDDFDKPDTDQPPADTDCEYLSLDEALYANKNVCFDDTVADAPLPGNVKPELTVVARRENYVHIFGAKAEIYHRGVFWTNPNPENLPNFEINGEWNGFAMVFKLPPCRPWFALSNDAKTVWLAPDGLNTRLEDGVSAMPDGQGYSFVLTCGAEPNGLNLLTKKDFIQKEQEKTENPDEPSNSGPDQPAPKDDCQLPKYFVISRLGNNVKLQGKNANSLRVAHFWAWPNVSAPYDNIVWSNGIFDGCQMWYPISVTKNPQNTWRFVFYEDKNFNGVIGPWYQNLMIGDGIAATYQNTDLVFEIQ